MIGDRAPHASQCCPASALRELDPEEQRALDRYCRRALDDPGASPETGAEAAAVARYDALLTARARSCRRPVRAGGELLTMR